MKACRILSLTTAHNKAGYLHLLLPTLLALAAQLPAQQPAVSPGTNAPGTNGPKLDFIRPDGKSDGFSLGVVFKPDERATTNPPATGGPSPQAGTSRTSDKRALDLMLAGDTPATKEELAAAAKVFQEGRRFANGEGVPQDFERAAKQYRRAAGRGSADAQHALGECYFKGQGVRQDYSEAAAWFLKAAEQGHASAQVELAFLYRSGLGVNKDEAEAVKWYRQAAAQGEQEALLQLAISYDLGRGVPKDATQAANWYRRVAEQGFEPAQITLGLRYLKGEGVPRDYVEAYKWFCLAAARGGDGAKKLLGMVEEQMTPEQVAEAQRLARDFKPRKAPKAGEPASPQGIADSRPAASGTGFFITEDGFFVTNEHVVREAVQVRVLTGAGLIAARLIKVDAANDLALLKAEGRCTALPVVASRTVKLGSTVATVGFPNIGLQGFAPKLTKGEIAALTGAQDDPRYFQISVPVQPGNSGGALVDERGNVVGVVSAKLSAKDGSESERALPENVNYAVKSSFLLSFLESVPEVSAKLKEPGQARPEV